MSDIKLFRIASGDVAELAGTTDAVEKSVQVLFESNLEALLGVRFLASEFATTHRGRIDTLGLDENGCPVILEYKRASNENVINQGLFYRRCCRSQCVSAVFPFRVEFMPRV